MTVHTQYHEALQRIHRQIQGALSAANRPEDHVRIIGVTKTVSPAAIEHLIQAGLTDFGENRWQHAREMVAASRANEATWHFIGRLQMNKVKYIVKNFHWVHSLDSVELAKEVGNQAAKHGTVMSGLVQVNVSGESSKQGVHPEQVRDFVEQAFSVSGLKLRGLMTMAPRDASADEVRGVFRQLKALQHQVLASGFEDFTELSMGMSDDFVYAVEEGATMVRLGRILVGESA